MFDANHAAIGSNQVSGCPTLDVGFSVPTYYDLAADWNGERLSRDFREARTMLSAREEI